MTIIAIDYDDTFTADSEYWTAVINLGIERGHSYVCVTGRTADYPINPRREPALPPGVDVVYAGPVFKQDAALKAGYAVRIWIDDMPGMIQSAKILSFDDDEPIPTALATCPTSHPDDAAVDRFAVAMKAKLEIKRAEGRSGWDDRETCSNDSLAQMLIEHIPKGDPVDIANFAMMIHQRDAQGIENGTVDNLPDGVKAISLAAHRVEPPEMAWQHGYMAGRDAPDASAALASRPTTPERTPEQRERDEEYKRLADKCNCGIGGVGQCPFHGIRPTIQAPAEPARPNMTGAAPFNPTPMGSINLAHCGCSSWTDGLGGTGEFKCEAHRAPPTPVEVPGNPLGEKP